MTPRPWQVWSHPTHRPPRVVRTYATLERAQVEADRNNAILAANPDTARYWLRFTVRKRRP